MADIMQGDFLTKAEGDDSELAYAKSNSGISKRMRQILDSKLETEEAVASAPTEPESKSEKSAPEPKSESDLAISHYKLVNLLGRGCRLCYDGPYIEPPKGNPSIMAKVKKVYSIDERGNRNETSQWKLVVKRPNCEVELPEPEPGIIYLVDARIYEVIPAKHRRKDLLPVYRSKGNESNPPGLYVVRRTNTTSRT